MTRPAAASLPDRTQAGPRPPWHARDYAAALLDMGDTPGRVVRYRTGWRIDWSPWLKGSERYLYSDRGRRFESEMDADRVRVAVGRALRDVSLSDAVAVFRRSARDRYLVPAMIDRWLAEYVDRELQPRSRKQYHQVAKTLKADWDGVHAHEVSSRAAQAWAQRLQGRTKADRTPYSFRTLSAHIKIFKSFWSWAVREDASGRLGPILSPKLSAGLVKAQRHEERRRATVLDAQQQAAVIQAIPERSRGIFYSCCMAIRISEARALLICDVDFEARTFTVNRSLMGPGLDADFGPPKTEGGTYPMPPDLHAWLLKYRGDARANPTAPLFPAPTNPTLCASYSWVYGVWTRAAREIGVEVSPYLGMKHSTLTALLESGVSMEDAAAMGRHNVATMLAHYDRSRDQRRRRAGQALQDLPR